MLKNSKSYWWKCWIGFLWRLAAGGRPSCWSTLDTTHSAALLLQCNGSSTSALCSILQQQHTEHSSCSNTAMLIPCISSRTKYRITSSISAACDVSLQRFNSLYAAASIVAVAAALQHDCRIRVFAAAAWQLRQNYSVAIASSNKASAAALLHTASRAA